MNVKQAKALIRSLGAVEDIDLIEWYANSVLSAVAVIREDAEVREARTQALLRQFSGG